MLPLCGKDEEINHGKRIQHGVDRKIYLSQDLNVYVNSRGTPVGEVWQEFARDFGHTF